MTVTVVHLMGTLMERQLDEAAGFLLQSELETRGISVITRARHEEILGESRVHRREAERRARDPADLVVMAVGIRPGTGLAKSAGLDVERGIVVGDDMVTSDPAI